jgi:hypothetical protein
MRTFLVAVVALHLAVPVAPGDDPVRQLQPNQQMCAVTKATEAVPPSDNDAFRGSNGTWYANNDRTIWAGGMATQLRAGPEGNKVPWIRPKGSVLTVVGRRLDGDSLPLKASVPCCYEGTFQATGLFVPSEGCWEITARAGDSELTFVTQVKAALKPQE